MLYMYVCSYMYVCVFAFQDLDHFYQQDVMRVAQSSLRQSRFSYRNHIADDDRVHLFALQASSFQRRLGSCCL